MVQGLSAVPKARISTNLRSENNQVLKRLFKHLIDIRRADIEEASIVTRERLTQDLHTPSLRVVGSEQKVCPETQKSHNGDSQVRSVQLHMLLLS